MGLDQMAIHLVTTQCHVDNFHSFCNSQTGRLAEESPVQVFVKISHLDFTYIMYLEKMPLLLSSFGVYVSNLHS